jgi:hypothetical protein
MSDCAVIDACSTSVEYRSNSDILFPVRYGLSFLPTECICVFRMVLTINSDCFPKQH